VRKRTLVLSAAIAFLPACQEIREPPVAAVSALADSADQVMFGVKTLLTDRGLLRAELSADTAFFFDDNTRVEMRKVRTTFFTNTGQRHSVLTAEEGTYNTRLSETEARGNVVVVGEGGRKLTTEQLEYEQGQNEIKSDSAFVFTAPNRRLEGVGFVSDPEMSRIRVLKEVEGEDQGTFTLPEP
jgi:LPS export ABC transporter protein LptC